MLPRLHTCETAFAGKLVSICPGAAATLPDRRRPPLRTIGVSPALRREALCERSSCLDEPSECHRASFADQV
jgi:hypothetical protein